MEPLFACIRVRMPADACRHVRAVAAAVWPVSSGCSGLLCTRPAAAAAAASTCAAQPAPRRQWCPMQLRLFSSNYRGDSRHDASSNGDKKPAQDEFWQPRHKTHDPRRKLTVDVEDDMEVMVVTAEGEVTREQLSLQDIKRISNLHARDLLSISLKTTDNMPLFRARRDCILMHLSHIRALVFYNKVLIFDPDKRFVCEFVADLARDMAEGAQDDSNAPGSGTADDVRRALAAEMHEFQVSTEESDVPAGKRVSQASLVPGELDVDMDPNLEDLPDDTSSSDHWRGLSLNPFEFRVLEHSLSSVCHKYQKRISFVTPITRRLLRGLGATGSVPDELQLHRMFPLRESIRAFDDATADMLREMENLMQEDSELARLCLTYRFHKRRDLALGQALPSEDEDRRRRMWVGEVEMLLQTYYARIVSINRTLVGLRRSIAGAHEMMNTHMSNYRNHLIEVNLQLTMLTAGIGIGTFFAGVFGMNLLSGLEEHPWAFWAIGGGCMSVSAGFFLLYHKWAHYHGAAASARKVEQVTALATQIDELASTMAAMSYAPHPVSKAQFKAVHVMGDNRGKLSSDEVDLVFDAFDTDGDGVLQYDEYLALLEDPEIPVSRRHDAPSYAGVLHKADDL